MYEQANASWCSNKQPQGSWLGVQAACRLRPLWNTARQLQRGSFCQDQSQVCQYAILPKLHAMRWMHLILQQQRFIIWSWAGTETLCLECWLQKHLWWSLHAMLLQKYPGSWQMSLRKLDPWRHAQRWYQWVLAFCQLQKHHEQRLQENAAQTKRRLCFVPCLQAQGSQMAKHSRHQGRWSAGRGHIFPRGYPNSICLQLPPQSKRTVKTSNLWMRSSWANDQNSTLLSEWLMGQYCSRFSRDRCHLPWWAK